MSNYKIRVNSKAESKEAQQLFFELGYNWFKKGYVEVKTPETIMSFENGALSTGIRGSINHKEITLPELRDLVVLKRNDVGDATHFGKNLGIPYFVSSNGDVKVWDKKGWVLACAALDDLKPIEKKEMKVKEYLMPSDDYKLIKAYRKEGNDWIEIPEGANFAWKSDGKYVFFTALEMGYRDAVVVWSRHTHPEELPFIDDEPSFEKHVKTMKSLMMPCMPPKPPINDTYAEIETVHQSAWNKQEGGSHYKNLKIQPMQYALENKLDYAQANVVKYVTRHKEKNGKEDLLKAIHNLELMIEFYYGDER